MECVDQFLQQRWVDIIDLINTIQLEERLDSQLPGILEDRGNTKTDYPLAVCLVINPILLLAWTRTTQYDRVFGLRAEEESRSNLLGLSGSREK